MTKNWSKHRLKFLASSIIHKATDSRDEGPYVGLEAIASWTGEIDVNSSNGKTGSLGNRFQHGDILFGKLRPYLAKVAAPDFIGHCSSEALVLRPFQLLDARFFRYRMVEAGLINIVNASTFGAKMPRASWEFIGNIQIALPPLDTQKSIAAFLDRETARIDELIEKKQRLVTLLEERQNVLVEKHLNSVPLSHIHRLKFAVRRIEQGWSPQCEDRQVEKNQWGVLKLGAITTAIYLEEHHKALPENINPKPAFRVQAGDVLVARASGSPKLVGRAAFVKTTHYNLMLSDKHFRLIPDPNKVLAEYLAMVVNSENSRRQIENRLSSAEGMARNIGQNVIYGLRCPFPSLEMQQAILIDVGSSLQRANILTSTTITSIERLREFRSALITAAVTGQIDVATWGKKGESERRLDHIEEQMT